MTGGEDAEKSKDSEVAEDTGSPDRRDPISSRSHQESPLFKYLCDLSPIKPAKAVHVAQTYNELTFPPEPRIFASPRSSQRSSSDALKRVLAMERFATAETQADGHGSLGGPWLEKANCTNNPRSNITTVSSGYLPSPCNKVLNHGDQAGPSSTRRAEALEEVKSKSCKVESVGDDLHLSENAPHRTQFCAMKTSEMDQKLPTCQLSGTSTSSDSFKSQFANIQEVVKASPLGGPCNSEKVLERYEDHRARLRLYKEQAEASDRGKSSQAFAPEIVGSVPVVISDHVFESQDRELKRDFVSPSHNEDQTQLGQDTTAMAYFLGGDQDSDQRNREDDWSEDSSEGSRLSVHTTSECLKSLKGDICEGITMNRNIQPAGGSSALEEDHNLISEPTTANAEQAVRLPLKVNSSGQHRGFRRRCLDFDASVARGKSLDTGKKPLEIRNSGADVSPSCASISPAVLCDRADETSTATTSGFSMSICNPLDGKEPLKADSNYSPPAIGAACLHGDGSSGDKSGLLQLSGCCISGSLEPSVSGGLGAPVCKTQDFRNCAGGNQNVNDSNNQGCHPPVMPSGIGLHLNSLTSSLSFKRDCHSSRVGNSEGTWVSMLAAEPSKSASPKDDQSSDVHTPLDMGSDGLLLTGCQRFGPGVTSLLKSSQMGKRFPDSSLGSKSSKVDTLDFHSLNHESFAPLRGSLSVVSGDTAAGGVSISEQEGMQWQQPDLLHQHEAESPEEFLESPQSLKKRKRKLPVASGEKSGESCRRCNCKKSKCLKLYCECFAAGIYCVSSCACQECFNKPEFEETVLNTRQQIESRNPLAFAPKIVQAAKASPRTGEDTMDTPASARHKRGCNCKKSLCLKKYCECYQAGVGCSEGCRCEGCKNMYGRKEGSREEEKEGNQVFTSQEEPQADDPIELLNRMSGKSEQFRSTGNKNISPITPSFEHDGLGRSMLRLRSGSRKRASDEHCSSTLLQQAGSRPSKSPTWFSNTIDGFQLTANSQGAMELSVDGGTESPLTTMNISRIGHLSPQWEGLADICTLTPLPLAPSRPTPASVTTLDRAGESPHFSTQLNDSTYQGGSSATGHHDGLGRHLRRSPPRFRQPAARSPLHLTQQNTCNENHLIHSRPSSASTHLPVEHSQGGKNSMLAISASGEDDDTPDFLKCPEVTSPLQTTITKSGSPKQKRVTPPRHCDSREQGPSKSVAGSVPSSSPGLRNGRKFTLQALPSLPPVTPPFSCS